MSGTCCSSLRLRRVYRFAKHFLHAFLGEIDSGQDDIARMGKTRYKILEEACERSNSDNLRIQEFDNTYITAISTIRYQHVHKPVGGKAPDVIVSRACSSSSGSGA